MRLTRFRFPFKSHVWEARPSRELASPLPLAPPTSHISTYHTPTASRLVILDSRSQDMYIIIITITLDLNPPQSWSRVDMGAGPNVNVRRAILTPANPPYDEMIRIMRNHAKILMPNERAIVGGPSCRQGEMIINLEHADAKLRMMRDESGIGG
ncbi:hypothetical protein SAMD00023353_0500310 [Rosellinia necatrix]|uniref:Uncharacterized protein n=1 Tax=Rosellinia necatrix TaxID=77044 RepID=A0A1S8A5F7_ROSNE|nr:hypothetical protein SAMD00023353_0500310 [Rosellinia necatrix]